MGAWGTGSFENDDALDWMGDLAESGDAAAVESALKVVAESTGYLEAPEGSAALAAAEVVAALRGQPAGDLPEEVALFTRGRARPSPELVATARAAVERVLQDSELRELWEETDDFETWQAGVADLVRRLQMGD